LSGFVWSRQGLFQPMDKPVRLEVYHTNNRLCFQMEQPSVYHYGGIKTKWRSEGLPTTPTTMAHHT
jgi:hypothetical protein